MVRLVYLQGDNAIDFEEFRMIFKAAESGVGGCKKSTLVAVAGHDFIYNVV